MRIPPQYQSRQKKEESRFPVFSKEHIVYWLSQFKDGSVDDEEYRRFLIDLLLNAAYVFDDPDDGYRLTLAFNLTKEKKPAISLLEISQATVKCSDNITNGSPKGTPQGVPFLVPKPHYNHVYLMFSVLQMHSSAHRFTQQHTQKTHCNKYLPAKPGVFHMRAKPSHPIVHVEV